MSTDNCAAPPPANDELRVMAIAWLDGGHPPSQYGKELEESLAQLLAQARLAEAKWWRYLVQMHDESYFAIEGDKRMAELQKAVVGG